MTNKEAVNWIINLTADIGKTQHQDLWHYEQALSEIREMLEAEPERKTEKALRLLADWAIECGFGYDSIPEEYEKYKDDISGMEYTDGLIYIAKREAEHDKG